MGIKSHPSVIWHDDFERSLSSILTQVNDPEGNDVLYTNIDPAQIGISADVSSESAGTQSLIIANDGASNSGYLFRQLNAAQRSVVSQRIFYRWYAKRESGEKFHHTGVLGVSYPDNDGAGTFFPQGRAGCNPPTATCPSPPEHWAFSFEDLRASGTVKNDISGGFYAYWPDMNPYPGPTWFGNHLPESPRVTLAADTWHCFEYMVDSGTVGNSDGELVLWVNGSEQLRFRNAQPVGFWSDWLWFTDPGGDPFPGLDLLGGNDNLRPNGFQILNNDNTNDPNSANWATGDIKFDDLVIGNQRIGCIAEATAGGLAPSPTLTGGSFTGGGT